MTILSMSHDQNVIHAMFGKNYLKIFLSETLVLVCLIRGTCLTTFCSNDDPMLILTL